MSMFSLFFRMLTVIKLYQIEPIALPRQMMASGVFVGIASLAFSFARCAENFEGQWCLAIFSCLGGSLVASDLQWLGWWNELMYSISLIGLAFDLQIVLVSCVIMSSQLNSHSMNCYSAFPALVFWSSRLILKKCLNCSIQDSPPQSKWEALAKKSKQYQAINWWSALNILFSRSNDSSNVINLRFCCATADGTPLLTWQAIRSDAPGETVVLGVPPCQPV